MKRIKPILEYPVAVFGLSEDEKVLIHFLRCHPSMPDYVRTLLQKDFPEFPRENEMMLREAIDAYLILAANNGMLQRVIDRINRKTGGV